MATNYNPNSNYERTKNLNSTYITQKQNEHFYDEGRANELRDEGYETQSAPEISKNLMSEFSQLMRKEGELIRNEVAEKIGEVKTAAAAFGTATILTLVGTFMAALTATVALNYVMDLWLSALIVTAVVLISAGALAYTAKKKVEPDNLTLDRSMGAAERVKDRIKERTDEYLLH